MGKLRAFNSALKQNVAVKTRHTWFPSEKKPLVKHILHHDIRIELPSWARGNKDLPHQSLSLSLSLPPPPPSPTTHTHTLIVDCNVMYSSIVQSVYLFIYFHNVVSILSPFTHINTCYMHQREYELNGWNKHLQDKPHWHHWLLLKGEFPA